MSEWNRENHHDEHHDDIARLQEQLAEQDAHGLRLASEVERLIDCARVLEAYTGCTGTGYHRWLERRDRALTDLDKFYQEVVSKQTGT